MHYCPRCYGEMEPHLACVMDSRPHWYCLTPDCGTSVRDCVETPESAARFSREEGKS